MYTLINRSHTLCTGLFLTLDLAESWAQTFLPEMELKGIELLTDANTEDVVRAGNGWTWESGRTIEGMCGLTSLPTC
jgi:hypothetical protein